MLAFDGLPYLLEMSTGCECVTLKSRQNYMLQAKVAESEVSVADTKATLVLYSCIVIVYFPLLAAGCFFAVYGMHNFVWITNLNFIKCRTFV